MRKCASSAELQLQSTDTGVQCSLWTSERGCVQRAVRERAHVQAERERGAVRGQVHHEEEDQLPQVVEQALVGWCVRLT